MSEDMTVADGQVVSMDYILQVNGIVFDKSEKDAPLEFIQGEGHIIPGLEQALYGMAVGESKSVVVPSSAGYGSQDESAFVDVPRTEFPPSIPLEVGVEIQVRAEDGNVMPARIDRVSAEVIRLDFNHPLAGKELHFEITIAGLRQATAEELRHGHVHNGDPA